MTSWTMIKDLDFQYNEKLSEESEPRSGYYFPGLQSPLLHAFSVTLSKLFIYLIPNFLHLLIGNNNNIIIPQKVNMRINTPK